MKAFSHPGKGQKTPANINKAIENTVTVSRNEWKYNSDLELKLDNSLPEVPCFESEFNQVLLNLIINAADAINEAKEKKIIKKGSIIISSEKKGDNAVITVTDNAGGIPDNIKDKIFDPFFTTKEVGKGTGQGLPISFSIIHEKHGGSLTFETKIGVGTSFIISLPLKEE
jgi:signal transduction histidine kinase